MIHKLLISVLFFSLRSKIWLSQWKDWSVTNNKHLQTLTNTYKALKLSQFSASYNHTQLHSASHDLYRYCLVPGRACRSHRVPGEEAEGRSWHLRSLAQGQQVRHRRTEGDQGPRGSRRQQEHLEGVAAGQGEEGEEGEEEGEEGHQASRGSRRLQEHLEGVTCTEEDRIDHMLCLRRQRPQQPHLLLRLPAVPRSDRTLSLLLWTQRYQGNYSRNHPRRHGINISSL